MKLLKCKKNKFDLESIGTIQFNSIEENLYLILEIIIDKYNNSNEQKEINTFIDIWIELLKHFQSSQLFLLLVQFLKENQNYVKDINKNFEEKAYFFPKNFLGFQKIYNNINLKLIFLDFKHFLINEGIFIEPGKELDYWALNSDKYLFIFIIFPYKLLEEISKEEKNSSKKESMFLFKIDLYEKRTVNFKQIDFIKEIKENKEKIIDINISIKDDFIYICYIIEKIDQNISKYSIKYQIFNIINLIVFKQKEIELEKFDKSFIPIKLLNDDKNVYCFSKQNSIMIMKKQPKLEKQVIANCSIILNENNKTSIIPNFE